MKTQQEIADILYEELGSVYCYNCRFARHSKEENEEPFGWDGCEDCHRKYMGWEISRETAEEIAKKICN